LRAPLVQSRLDRLQDRRAFVAVPLAGVGLARGGSQESIEALEGSLGGQPVAAGDRETGAAAQRAGRTPNLSREAPYPRSLARVAPQEARDLVVGGGLVGDVEMAGSGLPQPELGGLDPVGEEVSMPRWHDGVFLAVDDQRAAISPSRSNVLCMAAAATWWPYALGSGGKRTRCAMSSAMRRAWRRRVASAYV
jgi:hypothetical protein